MTFYGACSGVREPSESSIWVPDAQVTLPTKILMAPTQMQTREVAAAFERRRKLWKPAAFREHWQSLSK